MWQCAVRFFDDGISAERWNGENDRHYPVNRSANAFSNVPNEGNSLKAKVKGVKIWPQTHH